MAAPMGQGGWEPILEPIDWSGIAFVILFGKTDDYEGKRRKKKRQTYSLGVIFRFLLLLQLSG